MPDLFGDPEPIRVVLHVNLYAGGTLFDWDLEATNPDTGDLLAMRAAVARRRYRFGPEMARMLLELQRIIGEGAD